MKGKLLKPLGPKKDQSTESLISQLRTYHKYWARKESSSSNTWDKSSSIRHVNKGVK